MFICACLAQCHVTHVCLAGSGQHLRLTDLLTSHGLLLALQRMIRAVASLGAVEVRGIVEEQGHVEVTCEFCNEQFQFSEAQIMAELK